MSLATLDIVPWRDSEPVVSFEMPFSAVLTWAVLTFAPATFAVYPRLVCCRPRRQADVVDSQTALSSASMF